MKCQILFSGKNKKNIINLSSAENAQRVVKVKQEFQHYFHHNNIFNLKYSEIRGWVTFKIPITGAADDIFFFFFFFFFQGKQLLTFYVNCIQAVYSHEMSRLIFPEKKIK